ncbi:MAG: hypothetical protein L0Y56_03650, partial [Nitrospira sp.]|nr:hypothetical protein [Nitrospira sp.]
MHPLTDAVFSATDRYLGLAVASDPELMPRSRIVSVGYANRVSTVDGATGGVITGDVTLNSTLTADNVVAGDATTPGTVLAENGNGTTGVTVTGSGAGGTILLQDEASAWTHYLAPGFYGDGGLLVVYGDQTFTTGVQIDGDYVGGTNNPRFFMLGAGSGQTAQIDLSTTGDASVSLPANAISAPEILDEPGIAANNNASGIALGGTMTDLVTVTINIPAPGYVVVNGKCYVITGGAATTNYVYVQIDQTAGGSTVFPYYTQAGSGTLPNASNWYWPMYVTRTYYFAVAGTYAFRMEGMTLNGGGGAAAFSYDHMMTATYYPTAYGGVITAVA